MKNRNGKAKAAPKPDPVTALLYEFWRAYKKFRRVRRDEKMYPVNDGWTANFEKQSHREWFHLDRLARRMELAELGQLSLSANGAVNGAVKDVPGQILFDEEFKRLERAVPA
jgi:hypothetical protein